MENYGDVFVLDSGSPSGLSYKNDYAGYAGRHAHSAGDTAGVLICGYWKVWAFKRQRQVHRIIFQLHYGFDPSGQIDHIDRDGSNNSLSNLREVTSKINARNKSCQKRNKSGKTGVDYFCVNGFCYWRARWYDKHGEVKVKGFSVKRLGEDAAFRAASNFRDTAIKDVGGYTESHGL